MEMYLISSKLLRKRHADREYDVSQLIQGERVNYKTLRKEC